MVKRIFLRLGEAMAVELCRHAGSLTQLSNVTPFPDVFGAVTFLQLSTEANSRNQCCAWLHDNAHISYQLGPSCIASSWTGLGQSTGLLLNDVDL